MEILEVYPHLINKQVDGCLIWKGSTCSGGRYGRVNGFTNLKMAHRLSFELSFGEIPADKVVMHSCDNGLCVNPAHLSLGTQSENMLDCANKSRHPGMFKDQGGANNANAKPNLMERNALIKEDRLNGLSYNDLKIKYNIKSNGHLRAILLSLGFD